MYILCGILFLIIGFIMVHFPEFIYEITESWKSYSMGEPSDLYKLSTRVGGAAFILVGAAALIAEIFI
jgi:hypothetical protein